MTGAGDRARRCTELMRTGAGGLYRGARTAVRNADVRGRIAGIGVSLGADDDYYFDADTVADYSEQRREDIDDHWDDLVERAADRDLSGQQYITAKELRQVDRHYERQGVDMRDDPFPLEGRTVWDATGGDGPFARYLAGRGADVVMTDLSEAMVGAARAKEGRDDVVNPLPADTPGSITYGVDDVTDSDLPADAVDDAFMWRSAHVIGDLQPPLRELSRVVKPGGRAMFDTFNRRSGRRIYNHLMQMDSTLHGYGDVHDAVADTTGLFLTGPDSRFVLPYGAFRGLAADDPAVEDNVRWNERMEERWPEYGSVNFWTLRVTDPPTRT